MHSSSLLRKSNTKIIWSIILLLFHSYSASNKGLILWTSKPAIWDKSQSEKNNLTGQKSSFKIGLKPMMSKSKSKMKSKSKNGSKGKRKCTIKSRRKMRSLNRWIPKSSHNKKYTSSLNRSNCIILWGKKYSWKWTNFWRKRRANK